jgi:transducin (beta)-like 1
VNVGEVEAVPGFFGPLTPTSLAADEAAGAAREELENTRKRQIDHEQPQIANGPPTKRPRHSNGGYENGFDPTPMDVDDEPQNGDENAYPSPEQLPSPVVVTVGPDQGTQIEKVSELSTETIFLELSDDQASRNAVLLQCKWNPRDPKILAAAGTDALARMWTLSRAAADPDPEMQRKPLFQPHHTLLDAGALPSTQVTGLSWSSDGQSLAVASEPMEEGTAKIEFWNKEGSAFASFNTFESPVICLRWSPSNETCLALSTENDGKGTMITVMYPGENESICHSLPNHSLHEQDLDAAWTANEEFFLCGGDILQAFQSIARAITPGKKYETREGHALSKITYDWQSQLLATASSTGIIDVRTPE